MAQEPSSDPIDVIIRSWRQGDFTFGLRTIVVVAHGAEASPTAGATWTKDSPIPLSDLDIIDRDALGFVVISQTCELQRAREVDPHVLVAPLVSLDDPEFNEVRALKRPRYAGIPVLSPHRMVADLSRVLTISRELLAKCSRDGSLTDGSASPVEIDKASRVFAFIIARKFSRAALPDDFVEWIRPLREQAQKRHGKQNDEGRALGLLAEIRVLPKPHWQGEEVHCEIIGVLLDDPADTTAVTVTTWLQQAAAKLPPSSRFTHSTRIVAASALSAKTWQDSDILDLDYLSQRA